MKYKYNGKLHRFMLTFYEQGFGAAVVEFNLDDLIEMKTETADPNIQHWLSQLALNWGYAEEAYRVLDDELIPDWVTEQDEQIIEEEPEPDEDKPERNFTDGLDDESEIESDQPNSPFQNPHLLDFEE